MPQPGVSYDEELADLRKKFVGDVELPESTPSVL